jgi:hypothetical protein
MGGQEPSAVFPPSVVSLDSIVTCLPVIREVLQRPRGDGEASSLPVASLDISLTSFTERC